MTDQTGGMRMPDRAALIAGARDMLRRGDVALALGLVAILVILILPMPSILLDMLLALPMTFAVLLLVTVRFIQKPLGCTSFRTVLLVSTLLRLSLHMA